MFVIVIQTPVDDDDKWETRGNMLLYVVTV